MLRIDDSLRAVGLHPRLVPDSVKLTLLKQLKEANGGRTPEIGACAWSAKLLGYCVMGTQEFLANNGTQETEIAEARLMQAIERGYGLEARLVLLTLHARIAHPGVVERYGLTVE